MRATAVQTRLRLNCIFTMCRQYEKCDDTRHRTQIGILCTRSSENKIAYFSLNVLFFFFVRFFMII